MAKAKPIQCDGQQFASITALSEHFGVSAKKVRTRLRFGWTPEEAVGIGPPRKRPSSQRTALTFNGVRYDSLVAASKALGLDPRMIAGRVANGYSPEDALRGNLKGHSSNNAKAIEFKGKSYASHEKLCAQFGQRWGNVRRRVSRGWTMEQALLIELAPPRFRNFEGHAREHKWKEVRVSEGKTEPVPDAGGYKLYLITNILTGSEYVGLTVNSLEQRLKQHFAAARKGRKSAFSNALRKYGLSAFKIELIKSDAQTYDELQEQEVLEIVKRDSIRNGYNTAQGGSIGTSKKLSIDGKTYQSYAMAAEVFGVDPTVLSLRLNRLKWSPEEAVGLVSRDWEGKEVPVTVDGKRYASISKAAEFYGKNYKLVHERHRSRDWTLEQALDLVPPPASSKYGGQNLTVGGKVYGSFGEAGRDLGINPESFRKRVQEGMSPDEAYRRARKKAL